MSSEEPGTSGTTGATTYDVVLLLEQPLSAEDARQVRGLHEDAPSPVRYHLLLPVEDAAARVESAMGTLASGDALVAAPMMLDQRMQRAWSARNCACRRECWLSVRW